MNKIEINGSATNGKINGNGNAEVTTTNGKSNGNCLNGCSSKTNGSDVNEAKELDIFSYETTAMIADTLRIPDFTPKLAIICGTGLGLLGDKIEIVKRVPFEDIPYFSKPSIQGHAGEMIFGNLGGIPVICMRGRFHYYEGYAVQKCSMPVRVMKHLGCEFLIVTNAAGGLHDKYRVGDVVMMKNHINLMGLAGMGPLVGPNDARFGDRFPPMKYPYNRTMIKLGRAVAKEIGINSKVHEGVYICAGGPNYETLSEIKFMRKIGIDCVGMSTVHEAITAVHCGMKVFGFSLVTNTCLDEDSDEEDVGHAAVMEVGNKNSVDLSRFVERLCEKMKVEIDSGRL